jgi:K(+)-stimulated pyrophosphate-energized sodium pump
MNPIIKFTTLFGLLAVELAVSLTNQRGPQLTWVLAAAFLIVMLVFVYRSFYGMRIEAEPVDSAPARAPERVPAR